MEKNENSKIRKIRKRKKSLGFGRTENNKKVQIDGRWMADGRWLMDDGRRCGERTNGRADGRRDGRRDGGTDGRTDGVKLSSCRCCRLVVFSSSRLVVLSSCRLVVLSSCRPLLWSSCRLLLWSCLLPSCRVCCPSAFVLVASWKSHVGRSSSAFCSRPSLSVVSR